MKEASQEWLSAAQDDLKTITHLENDEGLTNISAFHAQQGIEKCLKAIIEEYELGAVKVHNLRWLFALCESYLPIGEEDKKLITLLDRLYLDARYPGERGLLPNGKPTLSDARQFAQFACHIYDRCSARLVKV
jgi:HEPN domain-containing protein